MAERIDRRTGRVHTRCMECRALGAIGIPISTKCTPPPPAPPPTADGAVRAERRGGGDGGRGVQDPQQLDARQRLHSAQDPRGCVVGVAGPAVTGWSRTPWPPCRWVLCCDVPLPRLALLRNP
eukprot:EG_transcript_26304